MSSNSNTMTNIPSERPDANTATASATPQVKKVTTTVEEKTDSATAQQPQPLGGQVQDAPSTLSNTVPANIQAEYNQAKAAVN